MVDLKLTTQVFMLTQHLFSLKKKKEVVFLHNINLLFQALGCFLQATIDFN